VTTESAPPRRVAPWRIALAVVVLGGLAYFTAIFSPIYFRNMELQSYVAGVARDPANQSRPDDLLRTWVLERANRLDLPVKSDNVQISRSADSMRIDVRYFVRVELPGYTVDLHFYPGAGSR
jgi:hypothetical protein